MPVTFVTAYFNIYENDSDFRFRFEKFMHLARSGINIVLFTSDPYYELIKNDMDTNVVIVKEEFSFSENDLHKSLPKHSSVSKDTSKFMILMQQKIYFTKKAIDLNIWPTDTHYAWIDFNICKVFSDISSSVQHLQTIDKTINTNQSKIIIPGCWSQRFYWSLQDYYNTVNWRFCGGFFLGDRMACIEFYDLYERYYEEFSKTNLTWEVNYWAWLEQKGHFLPIWYLADHNDSMVMNFPQEWISSSNGKTV